MCGACNGLGTKPDKPSNGLPQRLLAPHVEINASIGELDRLLSEFLWLTEQDNLDTVDAHTLKHHADDLIGVAQKALETLRARTLVGPQ